MQGLLRVSATLLALVCSAPELRAQELDSSWAASATKPTSSTCDSRACARVLAPGESCTYDQQCGPTGACSEESSAGGTCVARTPAGAACERSSQCQQPLGCIDGLCAIRVVATEKLCVEGDLD